MNKHIKERRKEYIPYVARSYYINDPEDLLNATCHICEKDCKLILPYPKYTRFMWDETYQHRICLECYINIRCDTAECKSCKEPFHSNNDLHKHLRENPNHAL